MYVAGPVREVLARRRPTTMEELHALEIPRFSKNNRNTYGKPILDALRQVSWPSTLTQNIVRQWRTDGRIDPAVAATCLPAYFI